jgi:hypothetical protein
MKNDSTGYALGRRELGMGLLAALGLMVVGCGGGDDDDGQPLYSAFNALRLTMDEADVRDLIDGDPVESSSSSLVWESEIERLEVNLSGGYVFSATWTDLVTGQRLERTFRGGGLSGAGNSGSLYDAYQALRPGMSKADVIDMVRVDVSQGASSSQVLWIDGEEALGVRFNGSSDSSTVTFAQWGLSIAAGSRSETRTL